MVDYLIWSVPGVYDTLHLQFGTVYEVSLFVNNTTPSQVSDYMEKKGFKNEAEFCRACNQFLRCNDDRGIAPQERLQNIMALYNEMLFRYNVPQFPPYGMNTMCGFNCDLAEQVFQVTP